MTKPDLSCQKSDQLFLIASAISSSLIPARRYCTARRSVICKCPDEVRHCRDPLLPILLDGPARRFPGLEAVIAIRHPADLDLLRQLVAAHLVLGAQGIPFPLQDQRGRLDRLEMLDT